MRKSMIFGYARVSTSTQSIERQMKNINSKIKELVKADYFRMYPDGTDEGLAAYIKGRTKVYSEKFTGTKMDRPEWNKLIENVEKGDTIVFDEVSRMSRDAEEGFEAYKSLYERGVNLVFIKDPAMNTSNFRKTEEIAMTGNWIADAYIETTNRVLMQLAEIQFKSSFQTAEHEVDYLHKRTKEGMAASGATSEYELNEDGSVVIGKNGRPVIKKPGKISVSKTGKKINVKKANPMKEQIKRRSKDFDGTETDAQILENIGLARNTYYKYKKELIEEA